MLVDPGFVAHGGHPADVRRGGAKGGLRQEAHRLGYQRVCLDVLPEFTAAQALYRSLGFAPAPPVSFNPVPGTQFLALTLSA